MKTTSLLAIAACLMMLTVGCDKKPEAAGPAGPATPAVEAPSKQPVPKVKAYNPEYAIAIEESKAEPKQYAVTWAAKVNSGGWTMKTDSVLVEEYNGKMAARVYVTLEQPNPADVVTEGMQDVTGKHDAGPVQIERVEFSVRRQVRGVTYTSPALYSVVKSIKYPY